MGMRKTTQEIRKGIEEGFTEEPWEDLLEEFNFTGDQAEDNALAIQCALFLEKTFPGEKFGWQDFDRLISERLIGRWSSAAYAAGQILGEELDDIEDPGEKKRQKTAFETASDEDLVAKLKARPGFQVVDATDQEGTVIIFTRLHSLNDVLR